jgi:hypothetical protein
MVTVHRFGVRGSGFRVQRFKGSGFKGSEVQRFRGFGFTANLSTEVQIEI